MSTLIENMDFDKETIAKSHYLQFNILLQIIENEDYDALEEYVRLGFDLNARNLFLNSILFEHRSYNNVEFFKKLVEKGVNVFNLNCNGENVLFKVVNSQGEQVEEITKFLLEKGLNPFDKNYHNKNVFETLNGSSAISFEFLLEHSLFDKNSMTHEDYLSEGLYSIALTHAENRIQYVGGINRLINYLNDGFVQTVAFDYYNALLLNEKFEEANMVAACFLQKEDDLSHMGFSKRAFSLLPAYLTKNEGVFFNTAMSILNNANSSFAPKSIFIYRMLKKGFSNIYLASKEVKVYLDLAWSNEQSSLHEQSVYKPFFEIDFEGNKEQALIHLKNIEMDTERFSGTLLRINHLFLLGMAWYYFEEYLNAEYFFSKVLQECEKVAISECEYEFIHATTMYKHIQKLK